MTDETAVAQAIELAADLIGIRHPLVWSYLLLSDRDAVAIDTGLGDSFGAIRRLFAKTGRHPSRLRAILLTHGHLDHGGNAARLRAWSGAPIGLHPADRSLLEGRFRYPTQGRLAGWIERPGRVLFPSRHRVSIDFELRPGMELDLCGGLRVVALPGHTHGHVGFYAAERKMLFCGDALLARGRRVFFPFRPLNLDNRAMLRSAVSLGRLDADFVYPGHHRGLRHNLIEDVRRYAAWLQRERPGGDWFDEPRSSV